MNDEVNETPEGEDAAEEEKVNPNLANRTAFDEAIAADKGEDDVKMAMITAGASFKNVTRLYNKYMVDAGFAISKEEKTEIVAKVLVKAKDLDTEEGFKKIVAKVVEKAAGVTEKSAAAMIRSWAKSQDPVIECFAKPKSTGETRTGFKSRYYDALVANPLMTKEEVTEHLKSAEGHSDNIRKHESVYQSIRAMANKIAANKAEAEVEAEAEAA